MKLPAGATPAVAPERLAAARASGQPDVAHWAAGRAALQADDLAAALAATEAAGHEVRDRVLERIAEARAIDCAPAVRALAAAPDACGAPARTLLALRDPAGVAQAAAWLGRIGPDSGDDVASVVAALLAEASDAAVAEARGARDRRLLDRQAPLLLPFQVLAATGAREDADALVTAWLQAPPARWEGEGAVVALLGECGLGGVPVTWFASDRRAPECLRALAETTDAPLDAIFPDEAQKDLARHWQKRHWQEVLARLSKATDAARLPAALRALVEAIRAKADVLPRLDADDAGDLVAVLLGAALVSHLPPLDAAALDADGVAAELARPIRRIDPRVTRALLDRSQALDEAMLPRLEALVADRAGETGAGLAVAALLRAPHPARLRPLWRAAEGPLPSQVLGLVLVELAKAGPHALPILAEALAEPAAYPTAAVVALIEGAPYTETAALLGPLLPRWLARAKRRALALCVAVPHPTLLPALEDHWAVGEDETADVIRLIATVHGDETLAARFPARPRERARLLRGPDGRPMPPPLRLLLRCLDCQHGYLYEVRQVNVRDPSARFDDTAADDAAPPGPPEGLAIPEPITCKRCGAVDRYRFTLEAMQSIREAFEAEMLMAAQARYLAQQRAATQAGPKRQEPPRLSPGGIILP